MTNSNPVATQSWRPCIIVPVYNHEHAVGAVVQRLLAVENISIFLIDDGSRESCHQVLVAIADQNESVELLTLPENRGKGGAIKVGFELVGAKGFTHALQIDADGQHDVSDVVKFLAAAQQNPATIICGYPIYGADVPAHRFYARYLTHVWVHINSLSLAVKDSMCGFRVYPVAACQRLLTGVKTGNRMEFESEFMVRWVWDGGKVVNMPTKVNYPLDGVSHFALWRDNLLISKMHTKNFFGMLRRLPGLLRKKFTTSREAQGR